MSDFTTIHCAREIRAGDHISWPTEMAFGVLSHHAIVVDVISGNTLKVIHVVPDERNLPARPAPVSGSLYGSGSPGSYWVREQIIDFSEPMRNGNLRRYNYPPRDCYPPAKVIQNARSKLGEFDYDTFNNNCEHFAQWCKTGKKISHQVEVAYVTAKLLLGCAINYLSNLSK